jgi:hypothetical protein
MEDLHLPLRGEPLGPGAEFVAASMRWDASAAGPVVALPSFCPQGPLSWLDRVRDSKMLPATTGRAGRAIQDDATAFGIGVVPTTSSTSWAS